MEGKVSQLYYYERKASADLLIVEEKKLLKHLQEEAVLCCKNERTEDELTAAIGMMLMHYQAVAETQNTPKNKTINSDLVISSHCRQQHERNTIKPQSLTRSLHGVQKTHIDTMKPQVRKNRKSNSSKSSLLASCRNILKEFLSQNSL